MALTYVASCTLPSDVTLTDGNWHEIAVIRTATNSFSFCVDGILYEAQVSQPGVSPVLAPSGNQLDVYLGQDKVSATPLASGFVGAVSEIRLWSGGYGPAVVLAPWTPTVGAPVGTSAPNLQAYWPFWGNNPATQLNDQLSNTPITLEGCSLASSYVNYYDDLAELLFNVAPQPFPQFSGAQLDAFDYLMGVVNLPNDTQAAFRGLYAKPDTPFVSYQVDITGAQLPSPASFSQDDLNAVSKQLSNELTAVISLWAYYNTSFENTMSLFPPMTTAASTVGNAIINSDPASLQIASTTLGTAVDIAAGLLSHIPDVGKGVSAVLKGAWAVYSTTLGPNESIVYNPYPDVKASLNALNDEFSTAIANAQNGLKTSVSIVAQDWGRLNMILTRQAEQLSFDAFGLFPSAAGAALETASVLNFMSSVIISCNTINVLSMSGYTVNTPDTFWNLGCDPNQFEGANEAIVGAFVAPSTINGPPASFLTTINNALASPATLTQAEVFSWPFQVLVDPGSPPSTPTPG